MSDNSQSLTYNNVDAMLNIVTRAGGVLDREEVSTENKLLVNAVLETALNKLILNLNNIKDL